MRLIFRPLTLLFLACALVLAACGGGGGGGSPAPALQGTPATPDSSSTTGGTGSGSSDPNVVALTLDGGTNGSAFNSPMVSVTVCVPGTGSCQTVDHVLVDTASSGLRIAASALNSLALPRVSAPSGNPLAECSQFASGFSWGSVRTADVQVGGEKASAIPIEIVGDPALPAAPTACSSGTRNFGVPVGTNGLIGVGAAARDCGSGCAVLVSGTYYSCSASTCTASLAPLASQVVNPVTQFASDNNGVILSLPAVGLSGAASLSGTLTFGIGTRSNNQLGALTVYPADAQGYLQTTYAGRRYASFLDTGSNAIFFPDSSLPQCSSGFYCPTSPVTLSALITSANGTPSTTISFTIVGVQTVSGMNVAPVGGATANIGREFDWGLPFFLGRTVALAFGGASTPNGAGPYWAF